MASRAEFDILRGKFQRVYDSYNFSTPHAMIKTLCPHKENGKENRIFDLLNDLKNDKCHEYFELKKFNKLCELYMDLPNLLTEKGFKLKPYLNLKSHHCIEGCILPYYLETARFHGAAPLSKAYKQRLCGEYNYFQKTSVSGHEPNKNVSVSKLKISNTIGNRFLIVTRNFKVKKKEAAGFDHFNYDGFLMITEIGPLITLRLKDNKIPHHCYLRSPLNTQRGFLSALMVKQSVAGKNTHRSCTVFHKYAHEEELGEFPYDIDVPGQPYFPADKLLTMNELKEHDEEIAHIVSYSGETLP